ncbi:MAG: glycosyltransferase family 2 protein [Phycisphaeraceae bacterium]|nr:glycosyltransferase family 2 protein [Phycisphaeraceae bacterium]
MRGTVRVSVLLPFVNAAATVRAAVRSILEQTHTDFELVVIDDGSTDHSRSLIEEEAGGDRRLRLLGDRERRGLPARLNEALDAVHGDLIARMDADDVAHPERFARQIEALADDRSLDLVGSSVVVLDGDEPLGIRRFPLSHESLTASIWRGIPVAHPTFMARSAWLRHHRFDAHFTRSQDQELLLRTSASSRFANLEPPLLGYREPAAGADRSLSRRFRREAVRRHVGAVAASRLHLRDMVASLSTLLRPGIERSAHRLRPLSPTDAEQWRRLARSGRWPDLASAS